MATPIFNGLILDLSKQIFDERTAIGESDVNHDYTQALLALALNRGVRDFLTLLIEKETIEKIVKAVPEYVAETTLTHIGGLFIQPINAIKGIAVFTPVKKLAIYVTPDRWFSIQTSYNSEEIGNTDNYRWTEYSGVIKLNPETLPTAISYMYIKNHTNIVVNGTDDLLLNQRFHNQLLDMAQAYIEKLTPVK